MPDLITTPASSTANAYISVAEADAYADYDLGPVVEKWRGEADQEAKERAIARATSDVDRFVGRVPASYDPNAPQSLLFPRAEDVNTTGAPIITNPIKRATYVQALYVYDNADSIDKAASRRARALTNFAEPNVSGQISENETFGQFAPGLSSILVEYSEGSIVGWIVTT